MIRTTYVCECCGLEFTGAYGHGGYNEHVLDHLGNMGPTIHRWKSGEEGKPWLTDDHKEQLFLRAINFDGEGKNYEVNLQIYSCYLQYMQQEGHKDILDYLNSRRGDIKKYHIEAARQKLVEMIDIHEQMEENHRRSVVVQQNRIKALESLDD